MRLRKIRALTAAVVVGAVLQAAPAYAAVGPFPAQFLGKQFTEGLGRNPTATEWQNGITYFAANECNQANLKTSVWNLWTGSEFFGLGYDNAAKLEALTRGVANTEDTQSNFDANLAALDAGTITWVALVTAFFDSAWFAGLVPKICNTVGDDPSAYWFGYNGVSFNTNMIPTRPLTAGDTGFQGLVGGKTGVDLQNLLNSTPSGGTVYLAKKSTTRLSLAQLPLVIPAGVTLTTTNVTTAPPTTTQYSLMGNIQLDGFSVYSGAGIKLMPGAKLANVWLDGNRNNYVNWTDEPQSPPAPYPHQSTLISMAGGAGTQVSNSRIGNFASFRGIVDDSMYGGYTECVDHVVSGNFITLYSSRHYRDFGTKENTGIESYCSKSTVTGNTIVDSTDWGIAVSPWRSDIVQADMLTQITSNTVIQYGNSSFAAAGFSAEGCACGYSVTIPFTGSAIKNNLVWASSRTHISEVFTVGNRMWSADPGVNKTDYAVIQDNQVGLSSTIRVLTEEIYSVNAGLHTTAINTTGWWTLQQIPGNTCPTDPVKVTYGGVTAGWASFVAYQGTLHDADIVACQTV